MQIDWHEFFPEEKSLTRLIKRFDHNQDGNVDIGELLGIFLADRTLEDIEESPKDGDADRREEDTAREKQPRLEALRADIRVYEKRLLDLRKQRARLRETLAEQSHPTAALRDPSLRQVATEALELKRQNLRLRARQIRAQQALKDTGRLLRSAQGGGGHGGSGGTVKPALAMSLLNSTRQPADVDAEMWFRFQEHVESLKQGKALQETRQGEELGRLKEESDHWRVRILEAKRRIVEKEQEARENAAYLYSLRRALEQRRALAGGGPGGAEGANDHAGCYAQPAGEEYLPSPSATPRRAPKHPASSKLPALTPR